MEPGSKLRKLAALGCALMFILSCIDIIYVFWLHTSLPSWRDAVNLVGFGLLYFFFKYSKSPTLE